MLDENKNNNTGQGWTAWGVGKYILTAASALGASYFGFSYWSLLFQGEQESVDVALADNSLGDVSNILAPVTMADDIPHHSAASRKLLSTNVTVINPIPDQQVEATTEYRYSIDAANVFSEGVAAIGIVGEDNAPLPSWLRWEAIVGSYDKPGQPQSVVVQGDTAYVAAGLDLQLLNVSNPVAITFLGSYGTLDVAWDVFVRGSTAYLADGRSGLQVLDVSVPSNVTLLGNYTMSDFSYGVFIQGSTAYVADGNSGLHVLDVSNPAAITLFGSYNTPGKARGVVLQGNTAYVADGWSGGLQVLDVSNPAAITLLGNYDTPDFATGVVVQGSIAYVADGDSGLQVLDVSNPAAITLLDSYDTPGLAQSIVLQGNVAYVADERSGLQVLDVSNPSNVVLLGSYYTPDEADGVFVLGNLVYVADNFSGLQLLDLSGGELIGTATTALVGQIYPLEVKAFNVQGQQTINAFALTINQLPKRQDNSLANHSLFPGGALRLDLDSDALFSDSDNNFLKLSIAVPGSESLPVWLGFSLKPTLLSSYDTAGEALGVFVQGSTVYVADGFSGLAVLDVVSSVPTFLGSYDTPLQAWDVFVAGSVAYVAEWFSLQVLDVSNPGNITFLSSYSTSALSQDIFVLGSTVYMLDSTQGLAVLDVSNPANVTFLGGYNTPGFAQDIFIQGNTAYVAGGFSGGLQVLDVSNPATITLLGSYDTPGSAEGVFVQDGMAYVVDGLWGLQVLDVSDPANVTFVGGYDTPGVARNVVVQGSTAYVADGDFGLQVLDVGNLAAITLLGSHNTPGTAQNVFVQGVEAYVADDPDFGFASSGLQIIDLSQWELTANPTAADVGNYKIVLTVSDDLGGTASDTFTIRVEGPPSFNGTISNQALSVGEAYNYFVPQRIVVDPNDDVVTFSAELNNGGMLPSWLSFNPFSAAFAGTPDVAGQYTIKLSATDNIAGSTSTTFDLDITHKPKIQQPIIDPAPWRVGREFTFTIPNNAFVDLDGNTLVYSTILNDGSPLPSWLQFDASTGTFTGIPPAGELNALGVVVTATDTSTGSTASQSFTLSITPNLPPQVDNPISVQSADVNKAFGFTVPSNTFSDPNQDPLTYSASRVGGGGLPSWLHFFPESRRFAGEPGRGDTGTLKDGVVGVEVIASDGEQSASTAFNINVKGASHLELALTVGGPIIGFLSLLAACYGGRAYCLNRMNKSTYQKLQQTVHVGETGGVIALEADANKVHKVQAKMQRPAPTNCCAKFGRFFTSSRQAIPGCTLPHWLEYNPLTNDLEIVDGGPTEHEVGEIIIQVKGKVGVTLEQFSLTVVSAQSVNALSNVDYPQDLMNPIYDVAEVGANDDVAEPEHQAGIAMLAI